MTSLGNKEIMAKNIEYYLSATGTTKKELAERLGIPYTTLMDWVNARTYPRIDNIEKMASYFNIQKSDLVEAREPSPTGKRRALYDRLDSATDEQIDKLSQIADVLFADGYHST